LNFKNSQNVIRRYCHNENVDSKFTAIKSGSGVFPSSEASTDKTLVLYLTFDEAIGKIVKDLSQYGHAGSMVGKPEWTDGKRGGALRFDGASNIEVPDHASLDLPGELTIAYWLKWDGVGSSWSPFVSKRGADSNYCSWVGNDKIFDYYTGGAVVSANTPIPLGGEWVFLAVTHDGKGKVSFYINGKFDSAKDVSPGHRIMNLSELGPTV